MSVTVIDERLEWVTHVGLSAGIHEAPRDPNERPSGFSVLEAVAYCTGRQWSDAPELFCPGIELFLRRFNEYTDDRGRELLCHWVFAHVNELAATAGDGREQARRYLATDYAIRTSLPVWLKIAGADGAAPMLGDLPAIVDVHTVVAGRAAARAARQATSELLMSSRKLEDRVSSSLAERLHAVDRAGDYVSHAAYEAYVAAWSPWRVSGGLKLTSTCAAAETAGDTEAGSAVAAAAMAAFAIAGADGVVDVAADTVVGVTDRSTVWRKVYGAVRARIEARFIAVLDEQRAEHGAMPLRQTAIEMLMRMVEVS